MFRREFVQIACAAFGLAIGAMPLGALSQTAYPAKPIRLIVPYPPGGPLDIAARAVAEKCRETLGVIVVENKPGAGGNIGVDYVAKQPADGYTLVIGAVATHAINPWLFSKLPYDPIKDFAPVAMIAQVPNVLVMEPHTAKRLGVDSLPALIRYARAHPGKLNYASGGNGSGGHMAGELLKSMGKLHIVHIPYAGAAPAQLSLLSGQTDLMFDNLASAAPQIAAGKLEAFAVTTRARAASFPNVPTVAQAAGKEFAKFDISTWFGVFAPAGTPAPLVAQLHEAIEKALASPGLYEILDRMGAQFTPMPTAEFSSFVRAELEKYRAVVKYSGARVD
jgi:tripartite-type tricarboxylate transporter receptor subunit TctC